MADASADDEYAQRHYQTLKFNVVSQLPAEWWSLDAEDVLRCSVREPEPSFTPRTRWERILEDEDDE